MSQHRHATIRLQELKENRIRTVAKLNAIESRLAKKLIREEKAKEAAAEKERKAEEWKRKKEKRLAAIEEIRQKSLEAKRVAEREEFIRKLKEAERNEHKTASCNPFLADQPKPKITRPPAVYSNPQWEDVVRGVMGND